MRLAYFRLTASTIGMAQLASKIGQLSKLTLSSST